MLRQVVLDTETTGISHEQGHRIIEIGCIELINRRMTSNHFHIYLNPERAVDEGAFRVHGISDSFLADKPLFKSIWTDLLAFIQNAELIIHNAPFDVGFLNAELKKMQHQSLLKDYCSVLDTLALAKKKHPGLKNNLDALCKRYDVDNTNRTYHGALLDAEILAQVYLAMTGGQTSFFTEETIEQVGDKHTSGFIKLNSTSPVILATRDELQRHEHFMTQVLK